MSDRRADQQLAAAIRLIDDDDGVRSIPLRAAEGRGPAVLHVVPVRRSAHDIFGRAAALVVLMKSDDKPTSQIALLQGLFDLTAIEAGLATRIAAGRTVDEIALADAKSVATVRNQLKSVLAKTGCHRQADIVRLFARLIPAEK